MFNSTAAIFTQEMDSVGNACRFWLGLIPWPPEAPTICLKPLLPRPSASSPKLSYAFSPEPAAAGAVWFCRSLWGWSRHTALWASVPDQLLSQACQGSAPLACMKGQSWWTRLLCPQCWQVTVHLARCTSEKRDEKGHRWGLTLGYMVQINGNFWVRARRGLHQKD